MPVKITYYSTFHIELFMVQVTLSLYGKRWQWYSKFYYRRLSTMLDFPIRIVWQIFSTQEAVKFAQNEMCLLPFAR